MTTVLERLKEEMLRTPGDFGRPHVQVNQRVVYEQDLSKLIAVAEAAKKIIKVERHNMISIQGEPSDWRAYDEALSALGSDGT